MGQKEKGGRSGVFLGGGLMALVGLELLHSHAPNPYSFITEGSAVEMVCLTVFGLFVALCAVALCLRAAGRGSFSRHPAVRLAFPAVVLALVCVIADRLGLRFCWMVHECAAMESNPQGFLESMIYMTVKCRGILAMGIWTTVRLALFGTAIAFVLAIFMVFLRIMKPGRRDGEFVRLLKWLASGFVSFYIFVIRGTPMMVQALIFYYFGFGLFKNTGMTVAEINKVWSFFISGLFTVSLNSTAYLAEVLRGGIQAVDPGQMEAARSLGMTSWQAMTKVVFPQAVKNSIPAIGNEFIINIKDSAVLSVIGVMDLMYATKSVSGIYFRSLEIYCVAAGLYLFLTWLSSRLLNYLGRKLDVPYGGIPSSN